jgi:hypothetical protein
MQPDRLGVLNPQLVESVHGAALLPQQGLYAVEKLTGWWAIGRQAGGGRAIPPFIEQNDQPLLGGIELAADVGAGAGSRCWHGI